MNTVADSGFLMDAYQPFGGCYAKPKFPKTRNFVCDIMHPATISRDSDKIDKKQCFRHGFSWTTILEIVFWRN